MTPSAPPGWGQSLSTGAAGIALAHAVDARAGSGDLATVHTWVSAMTREPVLAHPEACGLFHGAPAVAYTLHTAARPEYVKALNTLDEHITGLTRARLDAARQRAESGVHPRMVEFDLISGLTGIGAYLLHRHGGGDLLRRVLDYVVRLTEPLRVGGQVLPGWWTSDGTDGRPSADGGHANLGMAHGITGPLALTSTAALHNITVAGQTEAIQRISAWLDFWQRGTEEAPWWPETISRSEERHGIIAQSGPGRPSWCYGTPGMARARQLAALALDDPLAQRKAEKAMSACLADEQQLAQLGDVSLCHGWAGLVHCAGRMAADAQHDGGAIAACLSTLRQRLDRRVEHRIPASPGLLEGRAGIQLTRSTTTGTPTWDTCLLLAG
ncbi:lanthionine synthetase C family protein [Streptomyces sp. TRM 70351]|uniref:lanthionine synthetase C family protein n=1 Tax=Streptomyces sp. TRM 70351 TaxID=3116552 RepID=UPI002E7BAF90|nr:lanthionine synthetase C family protein [Streptomyces sp. TRM 70351]MEE1931020.1 lanthionine synthetase C family protein [Streptomyces sp. TRM 70351]